MTANGKLNVVIIDDEAGARGSLIQILERDFPHVNLLGIATGVAEGKLLLQSVSPDCVLLDIQMGDGTGFDLLDELPVAPKAVIFTTGFDDFALKAFRYFALDYLLKPVASAQLKEAFDKIQQSRSHSPELLQAALEAVKKRELKKIAVTDSKGMTFVRIKEIIHCTSDRNYTEIHIENGKRIIASKPLKHFDELLPEDLFFRIHQSHLVNLHNIKRFNHSDGGTVMMENGLELPVSRRRKELLMRRLSEL